MPRDKRPYITVHEGMPWHPKVEGLSDKAFRLLVTTWCWSSLNKTDGHVMGSSWKQRGTPSARRELVDVGLAEHDDAGGVFMHDYGEHQRVSSEIAEASQTRAAEGRLGAHVRHHVQAGKTKPGCEHCFPNP